MTISQAELFFYKVLLCVSVIVCFFEIATGQDARYSAMLAFCSLNGLRVVSIEIDHEDDDEAAA